MNLLSKKPEIVIDPIERLQKESESAISVFNDTINKLDRANSSILAEEEKELAAKAAIEDRLKSLSQIKASNTKFISKINQLFE